MESYLVLNGVELTSKRKGHIIIEVIRDLDLQFRKTHYNYYNPEERNKDGIGIGNWIISRKGLAIVVDTIKEMILDDDILQRIIEDEYSFYISKLTTQLEKDKFIKDQLIDTRKEVEECLFFLISILTNSILEEKNKIKLTWV